MKIEAHWEARAALWIAKHGAPWPHEANPPKKLSTHEAEAIYNGVLAKHGEPPDPWRHS